MYPTERENLRCSFNTYNKVFITYDLAATEQQRKIKIITTKTNYHCTNCLTFR